MRDPVGAAQELGDVARTDRAVVPDIGADIGHRLAAQGEDRAVVGAGDLDLAARLARVGGGDQMLAPVLDPLDRPGRDARRRRGSGKSSGKPSPRSPNPPPTSFSTMAMASSARPSWPASALRTANDALAAPETVRKRAVPFGEQPARLHRHRRVALHRQALAAGIGGGRERRRRIALRGAIGNRDIVGAGIEQRRVPGRLDLQFDRGGGVFRHGAALGDDQRHRFADEAHDPGGDRRLGEGFELGQRAEPDRGHRHPAEPVRDIAGGDDGGNPLASGRASSTAIRRIRPRGSGLLRIAACSMPGRRKSST